ncbi:transporter [Caulobacter mirabilis]|nr:transporter [Caulobacter mirabilis]
MRGAGWVAISAALAGVLAATSAFGEELKPLCPDRPGLGTSPCTLDAGRFQLELGLFDHVAELGGGGSARTWANLTPALKYGLTDRVELQASLQPYVVVRVRDSTVGETRTARGLGDLYLWAKINLDRPEAEGGISWAVQPYVKLPTADDAIGNGAVEGGVVVPVSIPLSEVWSLGLTTQLAAVEDAQGDGRHLAATAVVGLGRGFDNGLSATVELSTTQDFDPTETGRQYFLGLSGGWQPKSSPDMQWDLGINFGLNSEAPDAEIYGGVTRRF